MSKQYLINIAVGPVQEFIASARKLRDLWYGSYLLSELSKAVARSLSQQDCELIFPAINGSDGLEPESDLNVANKILAITPEGTDPGEIVERSRTAFTSQWRDVCFNALNRAKKIIGERILDPKMFEAQINDFGEFFAAWQEFDPNDYSQLRVAVEKRLSGRKSLREFQAPAWPGAGKPKSSLDGIRESVLNYSDHVKSIDSYMIKKGEYLDALGIVKRFGPFDYKKRPRFDNLSQVAALPYLEGLEKSIKKQKKIYEILSQLPSAETLYPSDEDRPPAGSFSRDFWPEDLSAEILHPSIVDEEIRDRAGDSGRKSWEKLKKLLGSLWKITAEPHPYACLFVGDGDRMGKTIQALEDIEKHQLFSLNLDRFARDVRGIAKKFSGQVVYSGGDDVMAYVPLHTAIDFALAVNEAFGSAMKKACQDSGIKDVPTFSAGMAIVHMHMPLDKAIDAARQAERFAKNEGGRNSLAIKQVKRNGSAVYVCGKWERSGDVLSMPHRINAFAEKFCEGSLPSRLAYQLRAIEKECGGELAWEMKNGKPEPANVATSEALRIIARKRQKSGKILDEKDRDMLLSGQESLRTVSDELVIALQFGKSKALASARWKGGNGR